MALTLAVAAALAPASVVTPAAWAHDSLTGSDPGEGEKVASAEQITLTFSAQPLDLSAQVRATDSAGTVLFDGEPTIDGTSVIAEFDQAPAAGDVTVQWRVVSSDGHPIEGTTTFTVTEEPEAAPTTDAAASAAPEPTQSAPTTASADAEETSALSPTVIAAGIIVAIALVVGAVVLVTRRAGRSE